MGSWKNGADFDVGRLPGGLPQLLRELAEALDSGAAGGVAGDLFQGLPARDWRKLVLVAERKDAKLSLSLKAKRGNEVRVPTRPKPAAGVPEKAPAKAAGKAQAHAGAGREKYRQLKKALGAEFKAMRAEAEAGRLPRAETVESFLDLAQLMCHGEQPVGGAALTEMSQANMAFLDDCQALRRAFAARDAAALAEVLSRLARRKTACHAQFRE